MWFEVKVGVHQGSVSVHWFLQLSWMLWLTIWIKMRIFICRWFRNSGKQLGRC